MLFRQIYDDALAQAAYLIACQRTGEAILIDPERDIDRYLTLAEKHGVRIVAAADTHIHADFLSGVREFAERGVTAYLPATGPAEWQYNWPKQFDGDVRLLKDGDRFEIGHIRFSVMHTPGHTPEHVSYLVTDVGGGASEPMGIVSGDFVFVGDLGRPDLLDTAAGAEATTEPAARTLAASVHRFLELDDFLQVWPGHGAGSACGKALGAVPQTTVGYERRHNGAVKLSNDEGAFVSNIVSGQPAPPKYFGRMKVENRDGPPLLGSLPNPAVMTPDRIPEGATIVDTRSAAQFEHAHLPGSISAPMGAFLPAAAGSYVEPGDDVVLVASERDADEAMRVLVRIGLDRVVGVVDAAAIEACAERRPLPSVGVDEMEKILAGDTIVVDVRNPDEFDGGSLPGTINLPYTRLAERRAEIPSGGPVYVHCQAGGRSAVAVAYLRRHGIDAINVDGGVNAWLASGRELLEGAAKSGG